MVHCLVLVIILVYLFIACWSILLYSLRVMWRLFFNLPFSLHACYIFICPRLKRLMITHIF